VVGVPFKLHMRSSDLYVAKHPERKSFIAVHFRMGRLDHQQQLRLSVSLCFLQFYPLGTDLDLLIVSGALMCFLTSVPNHNTFRENKHQFLHTNTCIFS
jgi:hypothetical protein